MAAPPPDDRSLPLPPPITLWEGESAELRPLRFRPIPPGRFRMGSRSDDSDEQPVHEVEITAPRAVEGESRLVAAVSQKFATPAFWMAETPTTQAQFARFTANDAYRRWFAREGKRLKLEAPHENWFHAERGGGPHHPAEQVSWWEAVAFCAWLGEELAKRLAAPERHCLPPGFTLCAGLPSEAQWEYAARLARRAMSATSDGARGRVERDAVVYGDELIAMTTDYWNGDGEAALSEVGWYDGNSGSVTHPVAKLPPNGAGLHDVHGNVWEWCWDARDDAAYRVRRDGVRDPVVGVPLPRRAADWGRLVGFGPDGGEPPSAAMSEPTGGTEPGAETDGGDSVARSRVVRGGSWIDSAGGCRSAFRNWGWPGIRNWLRGFRVVLLPGPVASNRPSEQLSRAEASGGGTEGGAKPTGEPPQSAGAAAESSETDLRKSDFPPRNRSDR